MKHTALAALAALPLALTALPAAASDYLTGSLGWFDIVDKDDESAQFGLEYRVTPWQFGLRPIVGVSVTGDGSVYGYAGLNWDVALIENELYLIPNFAVGAYSDGDGKDLGGAIEFRSGIELAYQLPNAHRIGVAFNHISNASIYDKNPGAETLLLTYGIPTNFFSR